jgi:hypothetical protein
MSKSISFSLPLVSALDISDRELSKTLHVVRKRVTKKCNSAIDALHRNSDDDVCPVFEKFGVRELPGMTARQKATATAMHGLPKRHIISRGVKERTKALQEELLLLKKSNIELKNAKKNIEKSVHVHKLIVNEWVDARRNGQCDDWKLFAARWRPRQDVVRTRATNKCYRAVAMLNSDPRTRGLITGTCIQTDWNVVKAHTNLISTIVARRTIELEEKLKPLQKAGRELKNAKKNMNKVIIIYNQRNSIRAAKKELLE